MGKTIVLMTKTTVTKQKQISILLASNVQKRIQLFPEGAYTRSDKLIKPLRMSYTMMSPTLWQPSLQSAAVGVHTLVCLKGKFITALKRQIQRWYFCFPLRPWRPWRDYNYFGTCMLKEECGRIYVAEYTAGENHESSATNLQGRIHLAKPVFALGGQPKPQCW